MTRDLDLGPSEIATGRECENPQTSMLSIIWDATIHDIHKAFYVIQRRVMPILYIFIPNYILHKSRYTCNLLQLSSLIICRFVSDKSGRLWIST